MSDLLTADSQRDTLSDVLRALGYTTRWAWRPYTRDIMRGDAVVFTGAAHNVWTWLRETGHEFPQRDP